jgi:hypothetical protein
MLWTGVVFSVFSGFETKAGCSAYPNANIPPFLYLFLAVHPSISFSSSAEGSACPSGKSFNP